MEDEPKEYLYLAVLLSIISFILVYLSPLKFGEDIGGLLSRVGESLRVLPVWAWVIVIFVGVIGYVFVSWAKQGGMLD